MTRSGLDLLVAVIVTEAESVAVGYGGGGSDYCSGSMRAWYGYQGRWFRMNWSW